MSAGDATEGVTRRQLLEGGAAATAAVLVGSGSASAQDDGNTTDGGDSEAPGTNISFPDETITTEDQGGAHAVLTEAMGDAEITQRMSFTGWKYDGVLAEKGNVPALIQESLLTHERSGQNDENLLSQLYNMMNRARTFALVRGKAVAIQNINNGATEQETVDGAASEVDDQYTLIQNNFLNCWQTRANRIADQQNKLDDFGHPEVHTYNPDISGDGFVEVQSPHLDTGAISFPDVSVSLVDGSEKTIPRASVSIDVTVQDDDGNRTRDGSASMTVDPTGVSLSGSSGGFNEGLSNSGGHFIARTVDADPTVSSGWAGYTSDQPMTKSALDDSETEFQDIEIFNQWQILWDWIEQQHADVRSNIEAYAAEAHAAVAEGEVSVNGLVSNSPAVMAQEWATDYGDTGHYSFAAASLGASGVAYDYENEMTLELEDGSTLTGTLYVNADDYSFGVGDTINPNGVPGTIYMAYASDSARRELEATADYRESVEDGQVVLRTTVNTDAEYQLETTDGESATIAGSSFEPVSPAAVYDSRYETDWQTVASLGTPDSQVASLTVTRPDSSSEGDNIIEITQPFTIVDARNVNTGEKVDTVEGENRTWQTTDVQLTDEQLERMAEYYDEHNNYWDQTSGDDTGGPGGSIDLGLPDIPSLGPIDSIGKWIVAGVGGTFAAVVGYDRLTQDDGRAR